MAEAHLRVAIVDDEDSIRKALGRLLRSAGMEVEMFGSGEAFLARPRGNALDCLVIDLHMPGIDGFAVQERLMHAGDAMPVIVVTGYDKPEYRVRAQALGVSAFFAKPVHAEALIDAIAEAVRRAEPLPPNAR